MIRGASCHASALRGSGLSLSHPELAESFPIPLEVCGRIIEGFVLLEKGVDLHLRRENKEPPKLRSGEGTRPICLEC